MSNAGAATRGNDFSKTLEEKRREPRDNKTERRHRATAANVNCPIKTSRKYGLLNRTIM
jgi:hypothetical protein